MQRDRLVLPKQDVVLEIRAILWRKVDFRDGHQFPLDLACARRKPELGHVPQSRGLAPSRVAHPVPLVKRGAAGLAACGAGLVLGVTPPTLDQFHGLTKAALVRAHPVWLRV